MDDAFFSSIDVDMNHFENTSLSYQYSASRNYFNFDQFNEDFRKCTVGKDPKNRSMGMGYARIHFRSLTIFDLF